MSLVLLYTQNPSESVVSVSLSSNECKGLETTHSVPSLLPSPSISLVFSELAQKSGSTSAGEQSSIEKTPKARPLKEKESSKARSGSFIVEDALSTFANYQKECWYSPKHNNNSYLTNLSHTALSNSEIFIWSSDSNQSCSQSFFDILEAESKSIKSSPMAPIVHTINSSDTFRVILSNENTRKDSSNCKNPISTSRRSSLATPPHNLLFHPQQGLIYNFNQQPKSQHHFYHQAEPGLSKSIITQSTCKITHNQSILPNSCLILDPRCIGEYHDDSQTCEYCRKQYDTAEGYLRVRLGDLIASRYHVQSILGQGTFGTVLGCSDTSDPFSKPVAIKIIRNIPKYRRAARTEIQILECIHYQRHDAPTTGSHPSEYCIRMEFWFEYCHHICMVFPLHKVDIYKYLGRNDFNGFSLKDIQAIVHQILSATRYMHQLRLIHTDIKPENILLKDDSVEISRGLNQLVNNQVLLIDFGSAIHEDQYHGEIVSTRHYRAPEIILGLGWSFPCDIWSIGCVLFELFQGTQLFNTHDNLTHLAMMEAIVGPFPQWMIKSYEEMLHKGFSYGRGDSQHKSFFNSQHKVAFPNKDTSAISIHSLDSVYKLVSFFSLSDSSSLSLLFDLIRKCMRIDPNERITAKEALEHPFFSVNIGET